MPRKDEPPSKRATTTPETAGTTRRLLTRTEAARALKCSESTVRRLEGDVLTPIVGEDGVHRFDVVEIVAASALRSEDLEEDRRDAIEAREVMTRVVSHQTTTIDRLLKHLEVREATQATAINTVLDAQNGALRACFERLEKLEHHRAATLEALEGAQQTQREHELEEKRLELQQWRAEQALEQLKLVVPHLLRKLTGDAGTAAPDRTTDLGAVSSEQMQSVINALSFEQLAALIEFVEKRIEKITPSSASDDARAPAPPEGTA
jgi:hypothetical protein